MPRQPTWDDVCREENGRFADRDRCECRPQEDEAASEGESGCDCTPTSSEPSSAPAQGG